MKPQAPSTLSAIRANRKALRLRGVAPTGLLILEAIAFKSGDGLRRLSVAALGRLAGVGRATALRHVQRLEAIGAVVRIGPAIGLNVRGVLSWCADACRGRADALKRARELKAERLKLWKSKGVWETVCRPPTLRAQKVLEETTEALFVPDRATSVADLARMWVPLHLRQSWKAENAV